MKVLNASIKWKSIKWKSIKWKSIKWKEIETRKMNGEEGTRCSPTHTLQHATVCSASCDRCVVVALRVRFFALRCVAREGTTPLPSSSSTHLSYNIFKRYFKLQISFLIINKLLLIKLNQTTLLFLCPACHIFKLHAAHSVNGAGAPVKVAASNTNIECEFIVGFCPFQAVICWSDSLLFLGLISCIFVAIW